MYFWEILYSREDRVYFISVSQLLSYRIRNERAEGKVTSCWFTKTGSLTCAKLKMFVGQSNQEVREAVTRSAEGQDHSGIWGGTSAFPVFHQNFGSSQEPN